MRRRALTVLGVIAALVLTGMTIGRAEFRGLVSAVAGGLGRTLVVLPALLRVDAAATARDAALMLFTVLLIVAPPLRYFLHAPLLRLLWLPVWLGLIVIPLAVASHGMAMWSKRLALVAAASLGWWGATRPGLKWLAFVPMLIAVHPTVTRHGRPFADWIWPPSRLQVRCAENDGVRPSNFSIDKTSMHYYAVTPVSDDLIIMTGERAAHRLGRGDDGRFAFLGDFVFAGNLWQGSLGEGRIFLTHRGSGLISVTATGLENSEGHAETQQIPDLPGAAPELDLLDAVYEPTTRSVFLTELVRGGAWAMPLAGGDMRHYDLDAFYLQMVRRSVDDMLVGISTTELLVFDPRAGIVTERLAAALGAGGLDVCQRDGAAVVADYAGRLRLFEIGPAGNYVFTRGVSLSSPRRVAFSPDCEWLATTSADDETAYVLRRQDLSVWRTFRMGPGLRDLVYTGARELAIVDACTVNVLPGGEP